MINNLKDWWVSKPGPNLVQSASPTIYKRDWDDMIIIYNLPK